MYHPYELWPKRHFSMGYPMDYPIRGSWGMEGHWAYKTPGSWARAKMITQSPSVCRHQLWAQPSEIQRHAAIVWWSGAWVSFINIHSKWRNKNLNVLLFVQLEVDYQIVLSEMLARRTLTIACLLHFDTCTQPTWRDGQMDTRSICIDLCHQFAPGLV